jgi:dUTP pyrophosphatase
MEKLDIKFVKCHPEAKVPIQTYEGSAGFDLYATECVAIPPLQKRLIGTGLKIQIPFGYYGRIAPRSGLAVKHGIQVMAGVVDFGYSNEVKVLLHNTSFDIDSFKEMSSPTAFSSLFGSRGKFLVNVGDRIAQIIFEKCHGANFIEVEKLDESERGLGGFGSSDDKKL